MILYCPVSLFTRWLASQSCTRDWRIMSKSLSQLLKQTKKKKYTKQKQQKKINKTPEGTDTQAASTEFSPGTAVYIKPN